MKLVIPGGSGQVGTILARAFHGQGHEVVVLARSPRPAPWRTVPWDLDPGGGWSAELDGADAVINLAGRSVNCRYTAGNRRDILASRVDSVRAVALAVQRARRPPAVWLQASTATIYAHTFGPPHDESGALGGGEAGAPDTWRFSIEVATAWERALDDAETPATRKVKLRLAMVMSPDRGGIFDTLLGLVRRGLGGAAGSGRQYVSWIHEADFIAAVAWLLRRDLDGAVNVASPRPLPHREFMTALRRAWGARIGLPAARWMLEAGARLLGTETELVLKSRRVIPGRLLRDGFVFRYADWSDAAAELCARRRGS